MRLFPLPVLLILLVIGATPTFAAQASPPTARAAADAMGKGFNLGQMFDNSQHPATLAAARPKIDAYYARGFRVIRIPSPGRKPSTAQPWPIPRPAASTATHLAWRR